MHRVFNIKHRIVRREEILRAPLATFDTIDLGDEDVNSDGTQSTTFKSSDNSSSSVQLLNTKSQEASLHDGRLKSTGNIGANNSKKGLSQAGGEEKGGKESDAAKEKQGASNQSENVENKNESNLAASGSDSLERSESHRPDSLPQKSESPSSSKQKDAEKQDEKPSFTSGLSRQGTIGRVTIPIKKQDSDSSSSSGSCNETTFKFQASRPSIGHLDYTDVDGNLDEHCFDKDTHLFPENIDPSQILSPSKRKAYERRIERLRVTTSPIARPRSHTPISVVTLDEYANISSPELSPAPPSLIPDKLKITLPCDEFTLKPKTPKLQSAKRKDSDEVCFEFTEEILFSRTKSALVVSEDGQIPVSPRRVLIPPTLTPSTSPKLSTGPRFPGTSAGDDSPSVSQLLYIQQNESSVSFFGDAVSEPQEENWATFPESFSLGCPIENNNVDVCEKLKCDNISSITSDSCDDDPGTPENRCVKCFLPLSQHKSSVCEFVGNEQTIWTNLSNHQNISSEDPGLSTVTLEVTPLIKRFTELDSEEILTVEIDQSAKLVAIDIKTAASYEEGQKVCEKFEDSNFLQLCSENCVEVPSKKNNIEESAVNLPSDLHPFPVSDEVNKSQGASSNEPLSTFGPNTAGHPVPSILTDDELSHCFVEDEKDISLSFGHFDQFPSTPLEFSVPSVSITGDNCNSSANRVIEGRPESLEKSSLPPVDCSASVDLNQGFQNILTERPPSTNPFDELQNNLPDRPPSTNPFEEFQSIPNRPPSVNPFEEFQNITPQRPPSTNPFEDFQTLTPQRSPSTNPFENFQTLIPVRSPSTNPFDFLSNVVPDQPLNIEPLEINFESQVIVSENFSQLPSEGPGQSSDLLDFLSSS
ncbi:uncharacterized protein LOC106055933 [Biomphalaria glabrata]|uniref:Uncharacterized protein LOC106055933 n=1 Tax=Biomphalaria glabrata TaxID=6526 RepID=A0A9W2ZVW8_BIOGL|nr:uncharacterized protein LOC106055933 [Biomphalaria glabrata]XP_055879122.1 uncharacterized protein LOC106055933 [Biomphalaria glabrata]